MFRLLFLPVLWFCSCLPAFAQQVFLGPVMGALTDSSVSVYVRPFRPCAVRVAACPASGGDTLFAASGVAEMREDTGHILCLKGLRPDEYYDLRFVIDGKPDTLRARVRTFPKVGSTGNFTFVTGSCQETDNMKTFDRIAEMQPYFLLHTGDFTYPDYQIAPDYAKDYGLVAYSYQRRYRESRMREMLRTVPIAYVYDDNDYVGGNGTRYHKNLFETVPRRKGGLRLKSADFVSAPFPPSWRRNVIRGYDEFFPHYTLPDSSEGLYQSFRFANAEFFFLDRCSARKFPLEYAFRKKGRRWKFDPPDDNCVFCEKQMDWLKNGLKNSNADWKFIVSGVPLNRNVRKLIKVGQSIQRWRMKGFSGFHLMQAMSSYWAAAPSEQADFYAFLQKEKLNNIIVISGDTHHCAIDDGRNAGLPELNASGLSVRPDDTQLLRYLDLLGKLTFRFRVKKGLWNQGGHGIGNKSHKNAFGKVRVVGKEYVELSVVDEDGNILARTLVYWQGETQK